jgi:NitT/TauT family transport system permease protein
MRAPFQHSEDNLIGVAVLDDLALTTGTPHLAQPIRRRFQFARRWLGFIALVMLFASVWEGLKFLFGISDQKLPHLAAILSEFTTRTRGGTGPIGAVVMFQNALVTAGEAGAGFVLGTVLGCSLAIVFAASGLLERGCMPYVVGSQTVPILAIAPMVVVGMGRLDAPSWLAKAIVAAYLTFFPVTIGMLRGLRATPPDALALMQSYAATPLQLFLKLRLPAALPHLFTSLKIAATASVIGAIVAELPAGAQRGVGVAILNAAQYYNSRPTALYATILVAALIGLVCYGSVVLAERLVLRERPTPDDL